MESYPKIREVNIESLYEAMKKIIEFREADIVEFDAIAAEAGYQSGFRRATVSVSANYDVGENDFSIAGTGGAGGITLTLDANPKDGQVHNIWKADAGAGSVTISGNGKNINGAATQVLAAQYAFTKITFLGGENKWLIQN
jgi:hypothetical protein